MWLNLMGDVKLLTKDIGDQILQENKPGEKQVYMSLPRPGVSVARIGLYTLYIELGPVKKTSAF